MITHSCNVIIIRFGRGYTQLLIGSLITITNTTYLLIISTKQPSSSTLTAIQSKVTINYKPLQNSTVHDFLEFTNKAYFERSNYTSSEMMTIYSVESINLYIVTVCHFRYCINVCVADCEKCHNKETPLCFEKSDMIASLRQINDVNLQTYILYSPSQTKIC